MTEMVEKAEEQSAIKLLSTIQQKIKSYKSLKYKRRVLKSINEPKVEKWAEKRVDMSRMVKRLRKESRAELKKAE